MIVLITGTPGTGKTAVSELLAKKTGTDIVRISDFATGDIVEGIEGETKIVNVEKLEKKIKDRISESAVIDGHLSHFMHFGNLAIVLRTDPRILEGRLEKKGFGKKKIRENLEAEALDVCLIESLERHKNVFEIDTTNKMPEDVVDCILQIMDGRGKEFRTGKIDWSELFFKC